jgi:superfamily II DNA or RNA helicase
MGDFHKLFASLDADNLVRGKQFERICKWYLENNPTYRDTVRKVWLWKDWEHNWGNDAGIDLIAQDNEGRFWAIQSKAYDPGRSISKADVDKFLSESSRALIFYRLLIATTDKLHHVARRTIDDQEKKVGFIGLADLLTAEVDWPESPARLRPSPPRKPAEPHDYQREAIRNVVGGFQSADRGQLIMACGTGKTLTSLFIKEKLDAERTLVLLPSLSLLKQTMAVWRTNAKTPFEARPVCSDQSVAQDADEAVVHVSGLALPTTSDPGEIADFLRRRSGPRVVFSTYQSSPLIEAAYKLGRVPAFDLIIADEAHRVAGELNTVFSTVLDAEAIKSRRRLFMTATPRYFTGRVKKAAQDAEMEIASMDDPKNFGEVFHRLSFGDAIRLERLTDYRVVVVGVDDATYRQWAEKGTLVGREGKTTDARTLAGQIGLAKTMLKYDLRRVISFHSRVSRAREFASEFGEVVDWMPARQRPKGKLWTGFASGEMTAGERHIRLQRLRQLEAGERGLLTNARCLSEGVDVPTLDGVAFIDPRRSEVDIVQAVGRAIRLADDKTIGTIVIPVFIDTQADAETALSDSSFKPVWEVVQALRAHDEDLAEQLDSFRRELGRKGGRPRIPDKIHLDVVAAHVGKDFAAAFNARLVENTTAPWEFWYGLSEEFVEREGHSRVPQQYTVDGYRLGTWIANQRNLKAQNRLSPDRAERLERLLGWSWVARDDRWEEGFGQLITYVHAHGNARVPQTHRTADGYPLGGWVATQRNYFAESSFDPDRQRRLEELPGWAWNSLDARWEEGFGLLKRYGARNLKAYVTPEGYPLGKWAARQRQWHDEGVLSAERVRRLEELPGWTWEAVFDGKWEVGYDHLLDYVKEYGNALVPLAYEAADGYRLGAWVSQQRLRYGKNKLEADRVKRLEGTRGWAWTVVADKWSEGFRRLQAYVERYGDANVPQLYVDDDGYRLGSWVGSQRSFHRRGELAADRVKQLNKVRGWVWQSRSGPRRP